MSAKTTPTIIIDTREKIPFEFANLTAERGTLTTGDYSLRGLTHLIAVERKSLLDLLACGGQSRDRFVRELQRLQAYRYRMLIVEATAEELELGDWVSRLKPDQVLGSLASWTSRFCIPVWLGGDHEASARFTERFLYQCARHVAEEVRAVGAAD